MTYNTYDNTYCIIAKVDYRGAPAPEKFTTKVEPRKFFI